MVQTTNLIQTISQSFSGLIWKIKIHEGAGLIAVESRNPENKSVTFSILNFETGEIHFLEKSLSEKWSLNLWHVSESSMILTRMESAASPEHKGLISIDANTGNVLWEKFDISAESANGQGIEVFDPRITPRRYSWIEYRTGTPIDNRASIPESNTFIYPESTSGTTFPEQLISTELLTGDILSVTHQGMNILAFHEKKTKHLQQRLLVTQGNTILLDDILATDIQNLQPEAFFIQHNHLFYVRNKRELISYSF